LPPICTLPTHHLSPTRRSSDLDTRPAKDACLYRATALHVRVADSVVAGRIAAHGRTTVLELVHENGNMAHEAAAQVLADAKQERSEEHTSESSHVKISYAVFCL